ncbi:MAG: 23S rRNA (guanosine(2251)-2'-O)-methyltransferase RlmB [Streptococcaceae bacterium]|jgi:23S rRNA (guanosine2251-2'-O)-methyltransferase|nr:23S rRNA (guanosine(2251)-2'-O)-methyltransferase RlmB [Streptococcaceae bacterium]
MPKNEKSDQIYGLHAVTEALEAGKVNKLFIQQDLRGKNVETIKRLARSKSVKIDWVAKSELSKMTEHGVHQGFAAFVSEFVYADLSIILSNLENKASATLLILDELTDPHNLGSIARTADATGVDAIIIPKHRAVGITPTAVKASTGALQHVPVVRVTNLSQTLDKLKSQGFWVYGTDVEGVDYQAWNSSGKIALIIGSEGTGISLGLKKQVDEMITIPMIGHVQSLNASVAASILMYEIFRKKLT